MKKFPLRAVKAASIGAATAVLMAFGLGVASAHVQVTPDGTTEGGFTQLTFSVPSESKTAATTKIKVDLPTETPFTSVRVKPVPGWTAEVARGALPAPVTMTDGATITEAPLSVTWTATDAQSQLSADQYQTFSLSVGRLPKTGTTVMLPTEQTYSDGSVRNWKDPVVEGQAEPQDPAPSFVTTAAQAGQEGHGQAPATEAAVEPAATVNTESSNQGLIWVALAAGVLGLVAGLAGLVRAGRNKQS
ncbi:YcnI family copper-binding membrane protein [Arthrobacter sp. UNC362MFTsu5.1]|uniref:YcnI family copper-binding membrane protein n=1 Tax=Arthrobacter sp. UNC362MFTsu5.1 TaxID=1449044 RepID=UPI0004879CA8|nr:YcnI family protein [Arthrobacter sp. UNC362MFTsu5.1]